ncbi:MAG TPA: protein translocase subunit SecF, partial [Kofleriaceae bacterium]|nr:protein translocase subunit SecF [Kofleriaceae bacterium]
MATHDHNFRYLLKPGTDFSFTSKFRTWIVISLVLTSISIGSLFVNKAVRGSYLNWTIDFRGGTEIIYAFRDQTNPKKYVQPDAGKVRQALDRAKVDGYDVSEMKWGDEDDKHLGVMIRVPRFGATTPLQRQQAEDAIKEAFKDDGILTTQWSGDRLYVRSQKPLVWQAAHDTLMQKFGLEVKPWSADIAAAAATPDQGTGEYEVSLSIYGLDRQYEQLLEKELPGVDITIEQTSQISAKEGAELRNSGIASLFYAFMLIVLYLAVRFDIRYAPGAIVATMHDAVMVVGVFSVTWTDVSLTSVAGLLTVIGFSVNDTVVIFDRIRENLDRLKDKKIDRIVDISLNEVVVRSVLTSATLFAVTLMMNVFGTGLVRNFAFAMNAGIVTGAYSSIFIAPPLFLWVAKKWYGGPAPARVRATAAIAS